MQKKQPLWVRIINGLSEASGYISGFLILLASLIILYQVLVRYFIGASTIWQTELSIYLLIFATFVGAAYGLKHDGHVGIDVITEILPAKAKSMMKIITSIMSTALTVIVAWKGWIMWYEATINGWASSTVWGPPLTYPYIILPIGMSLVSLQFLVIIYEESIKIKNGPVEESEKKTA
ncbi:TRAP transporter small permease [bacterium LRH843]|nr:TRAP transporter small permease [bacterium LRH843]